MKINSIIICQLFQVRHSFLAMGREFLEQPKDTIVQQHQPLLLKCQIHSIPAANVQWERNNLPLPQSTRYPENYTFLNK